MSRKKKPEESKPKEYWERLAFPKSLDALECAAVLQGTWGRLEESGCPVDARLEIMAEIVTRVCKLRFKMRPNESPDEMLDWLEVMHNQLIVYGLPLIKMDTANLRKIAADIEDPKPEGA